MVKHKNINQKENNDEQNKIIAKRTIKKFKKIFIRFKFISPLLFDKNTIFYYQIAKL